MSDWPHVRVTQIDRVLDDDLIPATLLGIVNAALAVLKKVRVKSETQQPRFVGIIQFVGDIQKDLGCRSRIREVVNHDGSTLRDDVKVVLVALGRRCKERAVEFVGKFHGGRLRWSG